ncbi:DUF6130 family protein [Telmatospirillum siberiense]|uniref:DUF4399 domain-containing protein n=1 Tax=Telmatospirillum siberiense TaxID=382514 RepID=A0A2N3PQH7_9PROT|nr:DUF6130 family protein [Telmatospirillum siberiense]PKU22651.1 hypothetical protein CWS72_20680 [Telmatospirillum siberiense]
MISRSAALILFLVTICPPGWSTARAEDHEAHAVPADVGAEAAAHLLVNPPLAGPLSRGLVIVAFRTENLKIVPIYGEAALQVTPRIGHLHVTVDDGPWHWLHASVEPIVIQGLPVGPHRILLELADANHKILDAQTVSFEIWAPR